MKKKQEADYNERLFQGGFRRRFHLARFEGVRQALHAPWIVFALSLAVRLLAVAQGYGGGPQDTPEYDEIAHNILAGRGFVASEWWYGFEVWSWRAPFYPFFLAGVYGVFGYSHLVVRLIQCVAGAMTAVLAAGLARRLDERSAPICAVLAIFYGPLVSVSNEVMSETWFAFWLILSAYWLISDDRRAWIGGGAALGLAILTRPVGVFLGIALVGVALIQRSPVSLRRAVWGIGIAFLVVLPWTLRNWTVHGTWPVLTTQGGFIVARSNAPDPDWRKAHGWGVSQAFLAQMPSEIDRDRFWWRQGVQFILSDPLGYSIRTVERFARFWYFFSPAYNFWFMTVLPFFLLGFALRWVSDEFLLLSLLILISVAIFSCVLYGATRFRLPLASFFLVFAGSGIRYLYDKHGGRIAALCVGGIAAINFLVAWQAVALRQALLAVLGEVGLK